MSAQAMTCRECGTRWLGDGTVEWGPHGRQCTGRIEDAAASGDAEYQSWFTPPPRAAPSKGRRMTKKTKAPDAVALARKAADDKKAELEAARETAKRLEAEYIDARAAIRRAQEEADSHLAKCTRVQVNWRSGKVAYAAPAVIVRKTPSGMLVVRLVGDDTHLEDRFKWSPHSGKFFRAEKARRFASDTIELRGVPAEYLPARATHGKEGA